MSHNDVSWQVAFNKMWQTYAEIKMHGTLLCIGAHNQCESFISKGIDEDLILILKNFNLQFFWF